MTGNDVRKRFLEYFKKNEHQVVRSSSLVPSDDPTLLFANAGMVQFKRTFLGEEKRSYVRATTSQKCVRAGGKHNDLENVGYTARHHTFFEMLGNFSFGDYFKEKAIEYAWDLLTNGFSLPKEKLWISIYLDDDESHDLWHRKMGVSEERIVRFGEKDNFWSMGETGPCGPCSEILIDRGAEFSCRRPDCKVGCECDRYLEIWNLVFMQFNRDKSGEMTPLPKPSIDTGMGLERIVSVVQNVPTNYETDLFLPIMKTVADRSKRSIGDSADADIAMKVIADHTRAAAFLIGDGILPSNEGRGYVLRRILRRAIRYGRNIGLNEPFLHQTAEVVFDIMKPAYPELYNASSFITNVIQNEEIRFSETLDYGLKLLTETLGEMKAKGQSEVPGDLIFKLYDTYGFPVDIVRDVIRDEKLSLDMEGFETSMARQREKSRSVSSFSQVIDAYKALSAGGIKTEFIGYETTSCQAKILVLVKDGKEVQAAPAGSSIEVVTDVTPFYGESGGQVGDIGKMTGRDFEVEIGETIKDPTGLTIHKGEVVSGNIARHETATLTVDQQARSATARNHTATHILHSVLRRVLGDHVKQAGSLVAPDRLRFDFTHFSQVGSADLEAIEIQVNRRISENIPTQIVEMEAEEAFKTDATALFEEKYGDRVRVVSLGGFSKELCGGTHTDRTGDIGLFKITSESSVASGIRRIEALTGSAAVQHVQRISTLLLKSAHLLKERPENIVGRIESTLARNKTLEREMETLKARIAAFSAEESEENIRSVNGIQVLAKRVQVDSPAALRDLADRVKAKINSGIIVLGSVAGSKALLVVVVTKDLTDRFHAGKIVKQVAGMVGGGGGGRPDMAQAGGTKPELLDQALGEVYAIVGKI